MRPGPFRSRHLARWFRAAVMFVLAAVVSTSTLAWLTPCTVHAAAGAGDDCCPSKTAASGDAARADGAHDDDAPAGGTLRQGDAPDDRHCSCPIECGPHCAGAPSSVVASVPPAAPTMLLSYSLLTFVSETRVAPTGAAVDILHVPRA